MAESRLVLAAEIAYSEMAFAVHDIASNRIDNAAQREYRSQRLAKAADELRAALDGKQTGAHNDRN